MSDQVTAEQLVVRIRQKISGDHYALGLVESRDLIQRALAAAVAGERERCAKVAEALRDKWDKKSDERFAADDQLFGHLYDCMCAAAPEIAAAIRSPETAQAGEEGR